MVEICMTRRLSEAPEATPIPDGYSLRWYREGDRDAWQRIQSSTGLYDPVAPDLFEREFGDAPDLLPQRQCFVGDVRGVAVGTATAWIAAPGRAPGEGRVHWVAVSPGHQRRGLGRYLTEVACTRMRELGADTAYLTTGSENAPAVQLYLGLGFSPEVRSPRERDAWQALARGLEPRFRTQLEGLAV
jgi:ribosomal protein S18 acetylase RimI-like enzyme